MQHMMEEEYMFPVHVAKLYVWSTHGELIIMAIDAASVRKLKTTNKAAVALSRNLVNSKTVIQKKQSRQRRILAIRG